MRHVAIGLGALLAVSAIVSVNLWRELRSERVLTTELRTELDSLRATEASLRQAAASAALRAVAPSAPLPAPASPPAPGAAKDAAPVNSAAASDVIRQLVIPSQQELMKDPEYRAARLAQMRSTMAQGYPGLVEELGLSAQEASRLFDVLAEFQMNNPTLNMLPTNGQPLDAATQQRLMAASREHQQRQEEVVSAMLGPSRFEQWKQYQKDRVGYMQAAQVSRTMESAGQPALNTAQTKAMREIYIAEQQRQREDMQALASSAPVNLGDPARMMEDQQKRQEVRNAHIVEAASRHLTPAQVEALRISLEQQLAIARAQSRLMRERMPPQVVAPQGGTIAVF